jgi:hypothetical protein
MAQILQLFQRYNQGGVFINDEIKLKYKLKTNTLTQTHKNKS